MKYLEGIQHSINILLFCDCETLCNIRKLKAHFNLPESKRLAREIKAEEMIVKYYLLKNT